jgi:hypothetical protein
MWFCIVGGTQNGTLPTKFEGTPTFCCCFAFKDKCRFQTLKGPLTSCMILHVEWNGLKGRRPINSLYGYEF